MALFRRCILYFLYIYLFEAYICAVNVSISILSTLLDLFRVSVLLCFDPLELNCFRLFDGIVLLLIS